MSKCPECGKNYKRLGSHWRWNKEHRPKFSEKQLNILKGMLMSDSTLRNRDSNPYLCTEMINKKYLEYIEQELGCLSTQVIHKMTGEENAARSRKSGLDKNAKAENYSDLYTLRTVSHPQLSNLNAFYKNNSKTWPENLKLTPRVLKHLYCGDGCIERGSKNYYRMSIALQNEGSNKNKINNYFERQNLPLPNSWNKIDSVVKSVRWTGEDSLELLEYMGSPPPGFKYKWPEFYR